MSAIGKCTAHEITQRRLAANFSGPFKSSFINGVHLFDSIFFSSLNDLGEETVILRTTEEYEIDTNILCRQKIWDSMEYTTFADGCNAQSFYRLFGEFELYVEG